MKDTVQKDLNLQKYQGCESQGKAEDRSENGEWEDTGK